MKKVILPAIAVIGLMAMSFTASSNAKVEIIKTETGQKLTNVHLLSLEDLQELKAITVTGKKNTNVAHKDL